MIAIEITESPDANVKTSFRYFKNDLYIGKKNGDLLIEDHSLLASHLMIEILESELLVHPQKGVESFLLNGKRATTIRKVKAGDTITFGSTTLKITEFQLSSDRTKKTFLNQKLSTLIETNSPALTAIERITGMMK